MIRVTVWNMTKQEFTTIRRRYRRACRDTWRSWKELDTFSHDNPAADEVYACFILLLQEFTAVVGLGDKYVVALDMLNVDSWEV